MKNPSQDLDTLLGDAQGPRAWWRRGAPWLALLALLVAGGAAWWLHERNASAQAPRYVTAPVTRGNLATTVAATGTLQPTRSVALGSELSGTVAEVRVDVNDRVRKGQVLVRLDTAKLNDAVAGSEAELQAALARERQAAATVAETRAQLGRLEELARVSGGKLPSGAEMDSARAAAARAAADAESARASAAQVRTTLATARTNLGKAAIRSPIDGIVLARNVEPGNAVAASLQAVTLFTLAEDLSKMKLSVNVDEADVAQLEVGQRARFTVAAMPGRQYPALVTRVAFGSTTTDNVVTYTTQLDVDNADLTLRPGMTANATIAATERNDVLLVPNSALRFRPANASPAAPPASGSGGGGIVGQLIPRAPPGMGGRRGGGGTGGNGAATSEGTLYVLRDGAPVALRVTKGLSDGRQTEVSGNGLSEGLAVIIDQASRAK